MLMYSWPVSAQGPVSGTIGNLFFDFITRQLELVPGSIGGEKNLDLAFSPGLLSGPN